MGLDYSINLYYPLDRLETALLQLPTITNCQDNKRTEITLPDGKCIPLPFTSNFEEKSVTLSSDRESVELDTTLVFPVEEAIQAFIQSHYHFTLDLGSDASIGYIYLSIAVGEKYTELSFTAATSSMSRLFLESRSIRDTFINFLNLTGGLFGHIDVEDDYYLSLIDASQRINIEIADIEIDFSPDYDVDVFVDRYLSQINDR